MRIRSIALISAALVLTTEFTAAFASAQAPEASANQAITYEQFMRDHTLPEHFAMFTKELSPEKKAELIGTRYTRCLSALGSQLTPEQTAIVRDAQATLTPDVFRTPPVGGGADKMREIEARAREVFTEELGVQFFTLEKECTKN